MCRAGSQRDIEFGLLLPPLFDHSAVSGGIQKAVLSCRYFCARFAREYI
jgi:hypothetical protein